MGPTRRVRRRGSISGGINLQGDWMKVMETSMGTMKIELFETRRPSPAGIF
jgi:hypothetical protein